MAKARCSVGEFSNENLPLSRNWKQVIPPSKACLRTESKLSVGLSPKCRQSCVPATK